MELAQRLFEMQSIRNVWLRTAWLTATIAFFVTLAGDRMTATLFPAEYLQIAVMGAIFTMAISTFVAFPLLFGFNLMALSVSNTNRKLQTLASRDPLTNVLNRRAFADSFETATRKCRRQQLSSSIYVIDVDHFKRINDQYGHDAGDRVLVQLARVIEGLSSSQSAVARLGGEEFAVLNYDGNAANALKFGENLRQAVEASPVWINGEKLVLTVSIGVHVLNESDSLTESLRSADAALYRAKNNGRNRVELSAKDTASIAPDATNFWAASKNDKEPEKLSANQH